MSIFKQRKKTKRTIHNDILAENSPFTFTEAYKTLRTNFNYAALNGQHKRIIVTSSIQGEGKSSVSINLATALAANGSKVLLVDADMRNPSIHRYLRIKRPANTGLSSVLVGDASLEKCLFQTPQGFTVLLGGPIPPTPVEMLSSKTMSELMDFLSQHYDYVICDAPPVGVVTDAAVLSLICDGVLFVIKQRYATKFQVHNAMQKLESVKANILGVVMNQYNIKEDSGKNYGYYRYKKYYYKYGDNN